MNADFLVDFPGLGIYDLPVSREAFQVFGISIYWYGLLIAISIIACMVLAMRQASSFGLTSDDVMDTFIAVIPLMIIFARLYYVVFEWEFYAANWRLIFDTRQGGLAFYGGVIGGILAIFLVTRIKKISLAKFLDFIVVYVPLGQAVGRWGNFFNQEAFGTNTSLPWGMYSNQTQAYLSSLSGPYDPTLPVHPTFLYEFLANMIIFVILLWLRRRSKTPLAVTLTYLMLYGAVRFFVEGIRTDALMVGETTLRISQLLSALMVVFAVVFLVVLRQRRLKHEIISVLSGESASDVTGATGASEASEGSQAEAMEAEEKPDFIEIPDDRPDGQPDDSSPTDEKKND